MDRPTGSVIYTAMLNALGGFESDLTAIRLNDEHYRLFVGTTSIKRDMAWLRNSLRGDEKVNLRDSTREFAVIGLMGPRVAEIAAETGAGELNDLKYFQSGKSEISGHPVLAARLSYVGEAGWEITCGGGKCLHNIRYARKMRGKAGWFVRTNIHAN